MNKMYIETIFWHFNHLRETLAAAGDGHLLNDAHLMALVYRLGGRNVQGRC